MARFPLPGDWPWAVGLLVPLARAAMRGSPPNQATLADAVMRAYHVRPADIAPLLSWCLR